MTSLSQLVSVAALNSIDASSSGIIDAKVELYRGLVTLEWRERQQPTPATPATEPEGNISVKEAARRLGISESYIYKNAARLPYVSREGGRVVCSARAVSRRVK